MNLRSSAPESKFLANDKHYSSTEDSVSTLNEVARSKVGDLRGHGIHREREGHSSA